LLMPQVIEALETVKRKDVLRIRSRTAC